MSDVVYHLGNSLILLSNKPFDCIFGSINIILCSFNLRGISLGGGLQFVELLDRLVLIIQSLQALLFNLLDLIRILLMDVIVCSVCMNLDLSISLALMFLFLMFLL